MHIANGTNINLPGTSVLDAMLRLAAAAAAANVNWIAYLRVASPAVSRIRRSHRRDRAVSAVALACAHPHDGVPTTTTRVRSLGTPIVHAVATTGRRVRYSGDTVRRATGKPTTAKYAQTAHPRVAAAARV